MAAAALSGGGPETPRRGRPRSAEADQAILGATLELAEEVGISAMSMDDLAARAGVSKATIYRRWASKEALVLDALRSTIQRFAPVDTGTLRGDLCAYLGEVADRMGSARGVDVLPHLIEAGCHDESIRASLDEYVHNRRGPLTGILRRGVERGELPERTDVELLLDVLIGPFTYRKLLSHDPIDRSYVDRLVDAILPGGREPEPAPGREHS